MVLGAPYIKTKPHLIAELGPLQRRAMYSQPVAPCAPGPTLSAIRSLREAVRAGPGVHWNFATSFLVKLGRCKLTVREGMQTADSTT